MLLPKRLYRDESKKTLRIVAFLKNRLAGPVAFDGSAFNQKRKVLRRKLIPKRMPGENIFESVHSLLPIFLVQTKPARAMFGLPAN